jgi:hypothetical protein
MTAADSWRLNYGCYSTSSLVLLFGLLGAQCLMFLHHAFQPRTPVPRDETPPQHLYWKLSSLAHRRAIPTIVFIPAAWCVLRMIRAATYSKDTSSRTYFAAEAGQHILGWAFLALLPAVAMGLHWAYHARVERQRLGPLS